MTTEQASLAAISTRVGQLLDDLDAATSAEEALRLETDAGAELVPMLEAMYDAFAPGAVRGVVRQVASGRRAATTIMTLVASRGDGSPVTIKLRVRSQLERIAQAVAQRAEGAPMPSETQRRPLDE